MSKRVSHTYDPILRDRVPPKGVVELAYERAQRIEALEVLVTANSDGVPRLQTFESAKTGRWPRPAPFLLIVQDKTDCHFQRMQAREQAPECAVMSCIGVEDPSVADIPFGKSVGLLRRVLIPFRSFRRRHRSRSYRQERTVGTSR